MEQPKENELPSGRGQTRQADPVSSGQAADNRNNKTDQTGGGQLTKLKANAARDRDMEHGASLTEQDE